MTLGGGGGRVVVGELEQACVQLEVVGVELGGWGRVCG